MRQKLEITSHDILPQHRSGKRIFLSEREAVTRVKEDPHGFFFRGYPERIRLYFRGLTLGFWEVHFI